MSDAATRADSIRTYNSGAGSVDAAQTDADACLGGNRSSTEVDVLDVDVTSPISNVTIVHVAGSNGTGTGTLTAASDDTLTWQLSGGTVGAAVTILNGETKIIETGDSASEFVRVSRTSATALSGAATLTLTEVLNNVVGLDNVSSAEAAAGDTEYRAFFIQNDNSTEVSNVKAYIATLGTQRTSNSAQLSASGAGTITTTGSFAGWPERGWCHIKTSGGTTREIVYYSSRTDTSLTIPSTGRALLGTSAAAGASSDTLDAVPGIRIAIEAPSSGAIQTIADESTAPTGLTWGTPITAAAALSIGTLAADGDYGIWIEYEIPEAAEAAASVLNLIKLTFDAA